MITAIQLPIDGLAEGETACVVDICGPCGAANRLAEIGLGIGVTVRMVKSGYPCILALGEQRLCFRNEEDCSVIVQLI